MISAGFSRKCRFFTFDNSTDKWIKLIASKRLGQPPAGLVQRNNVCVGEPGSFKHNKPKLYYGMSALNNLFGNSKSDAAGTSSIAALFSKPNHVDERKVKSKARTVLTEPEQDKDEQEEENVQESASTVSEGVEKEQEEQEEQPKKKKKKTKKNDEENDNLEVQYYSKVLGDSKSKDEPKDEPKDDPSDSDNEDEATAVDKSSITGTESESAKVINLKEKELAKAERTIFIGNVPNEVITSKKVYKEFKKLLSKDPRSENDDHDDGEEDEEEEESKTKDVKFNVESIRFRSIAFEEALPRKVAFVHQKLHKSRDSINAYAVYGSSNPVKIMCQYLNGKVFNDHHLRVDSVTHPSPHDKRRSVFVGNLDFEEVEESLWKHFEPCGDIEYVRIIRDSKTNMGKGFAYVQFKDFQSVSKALLLHEKKIHEGKKARKLRISRCKNMRKAQGNQSSLQNNKLNDQQRTKLGRAKKVLGKADRAKLGEELTIEGLRASKGETTPVLKRTKNRSKTGRVTKRSIAFKKQNAQ